MYLALHPFVVGWDMMWFVRYKEHLLCVDRYFPLTLERLNHVQAFMPTCSLSFILVQVRWFGYFWRTSRRSGEAQFNKGVSAACPSRVLLNMPNLDNHVQESEAATRPKRKASAFPQTPPNHNTHRRLIISNLNS